MITTDLNIARLELESDNLVAIPTETVYGLAANAYSEQAVKKIFALKGRPLYNPLIVHIPSAQFLDQVATGIPETARTLAHAFWPGPLTLVVKKQPRIPDIVTAGKDTVGIRVPDHPLSLQLLEQLRFPLAAPSANPFGSISPTTAKHVQQYFQNKLKVILDGGECRKGIESTIIGFENNLPVLYRLGSLSLEKIEEKVGKLMQKTQADDKGPEAPGMLSRHYAPATKLYLTDDVARLIEQHAGKRIGLLLFQKPSAQVPANQQEILSLSGSFEEASRNLYACMHRLDGQHLDVIIAERLPDVDLGRTVNDKLERAAF